MRAPDFGWCFYRPLNPPKTCRHCGGPYKVRRPNQSAIYACADCDKIGGGNKSGRIRT